MCYKAAVMAQHRLKDRVVGFLHLGVRCHRPSFGHAGVQHPHCPLRLTLHGLLARVYTI